MSRAAPATYDGRFYQASEGPARRSARVVVPLLQGFFPLASVLDLGCGRGAWLAAWREAGVEDLLGVDGFHLDPTDFVLDAACFRAGDLTRPLDLGRRFDLAQCLEVGEHLPRGSGRELVRSLTRHAPRVLFSAAPPGQGGPGHDNEQPPAFWRALFRAEGFRLVDALRPALRGHRGVAWWYRYNCLLFVDESLCPEMAPALTRHLLAPGDPLPEVAPPRMRLRRALLQRLPAPAIARAMRWAVRYRAWRERVHDTTAGP